MHFAVQNAGRANVPPLQTTFSIRKGPPRDGAALHFLIFLKFDGNRFLFLSAKRIMEIILLTGGIAMTDEDTAYRIWVDWEHHAASLRPVAGYEMICFFSRESYQENLRILTQSGFRFE